MQCIFKISSYHQLELLLSVRNFMFLNIHMAFHILKHNYTLIKIKAQRPISYIHSQLTKVAFKYTENWFGILVLNGRQQTAFCHSVQSPLKGCGNEDFCYVFTIISEYILWQRWRWNPEAPIQSPACPVEKLR